MTTGKRASEQAAHTTAAFVRDERTRRGSLRDWKRQSPSSGEGSSVLLLNWQAAAAADEQSQLAAQKTEKDAAPRGLAGTMPASARLAAAIARPPLRLGAAPPRYLLLLFSRAVPLCAALCASLLAEDKVLRL